MATKRTPAAPAAKKTAKTPTRNAAKTTAKATATTKTAGAP